MFETCYARLPRKLPLKFAAPGAERQDSVYNGFQAIDASAQVGAGHSAATLPHFAGSTACRYGAAQGQDVPPLVYNSFQTIDRRLLFARCRCCVLMPQLMARHKRPCALCPLQLVATTVRRRYWLPLLLLKSN